MAAKTTALVLKVDDKIRISYHDSQDTAAKAADKVGTYQEGYAVDGLPDIEPNADGEGMQLATARLVIDKLGGVEGLNTSELTDVDEARRWVWQLLLGKLPDNPEYDTIYGADAAAAEAPVADDDPAADLSASNEEESELSDTNVETPVARKKPAPAPAKKAAGAKKPAPAPAKKAAPAATNGKTPSKKPAPAPVKKAAPAPAAKKAAPAAKPAAKKAAPATKTSGDAGEYRISDTWKVILKELGKSKAGISRAEFIELAKANGAGGWFGRFITAGIVERTDRGVYKLTEAGKTALAAK